MFDVYVFPDDHTIHDIADFVHARLLADELVQDDGHAWYAYVIDVDTGENVYQSERTYELGF